MVADPQTGQWTGDALLAFMSELFPICRAATGSGVRDTLARIQERVPLPVHEVPTDTRVFDWRVPQEWNIRDAYIADTTGRRVVDFRVSNLHEVSNSVPVHETMRWSDLRAHLHTLPQHPDWVPFRTAYFEDGWGFCLAHRVYEELEARGDEPFEVCIDSSLEDGALTYGELLLPGTSEAKVLFSTHVCHPSLANDNLTGIVVATALTSLLAGRERRYSYRFVFVPATIGAIAWLSLNQDRLDRIKAGLVLALLSHPGGVTYKKSRRGDTLVDNVFEHLLSDTEGARCLDFSPIGYDERQFCSPGLDLPMGCLMRTPNGQYPEYHTSADDLELVSPEAVVDSLRLCLDAVSVLEGNACYLNRQPFGEPQLGRRGLYRAHGRQAGTADLQAAMPWVLNQSDGSHSLLDIAQRGGIEFGLVRQAADKLSAHELLSLATGGPVEAEPWSRCRLMSVESTSSVTTRTSPRIPTPGCSTPAGMST